MLGISIFSEFKLFGEGPWCPHATSATLIQPTVKPNWWTVPFSCALSEETFWPQDTSHYDHIPKDWHTCQDFSDQIQTGRERGVHTAYVQERQINAKYAKLAKYAIHANDAKYAKPKLGRVGGEGCISGVMALSLQLPIANCTFWLFMFELSTSFRA